MAPTDNPDDAPTSARDQNGDRILAVINYALLLVGISNGLTALTWIFLIGILILLIANIWLAIRSVVGLIRLVDGRPHSDPTGFWI